MFVSLLATDLSFDLLLGKPFLTRSLPVEIKPDFFFGICCNFIQDLTNDFFVSDGFGKHFNFIVAAVASCGVYHLKFKQASFYLVDTLWEINSSLQTLFILRNFFKFRVFLLVIRILGVYLSWLLVELRSLGVDHVTDLQDLTQKIRLRLKGVLSFFGQHHGFLRQRLILNLLLLHKQLGHFNLPLGLLDFLLFFFNLRSQSPNLFFDLSPSLISIPVKYLGNLLTWNQSNSLFIHAHCLMLLL